MELSSPELIQSLVVALKKSGQILDTPRESRSRPSSVERRARCQCGRCRTCVDDARWERIFEAKFVDPNYYNRLAVKAESPLKSF
jgi:hypothetical protein